MVLTVLGVVIGLTALVATLGLTRTAGNRIISQFDQLAATELFVTRKARRRRRASSTRGDAVGCAGPAAPAERRGRRRNR